MECKITVTATVGSPFAPKDGTDGSAIFGTGSTAVTGYPVGYGPVEGTLGDDGTPVPALLVMAEPALPGRSVTGRPVALLHTSAAHGSRGVVFCVPPHDAHFAALTDTDALRDWQFDEQITERVLRRLERRHGTLWRVTRIDGSERADAYLLQARGRYQQVTGVAVPEYQ